MIFKLMEIKSRILARKNVVKINQDFVKHAKIQEIITKNRFSEKILVRVSKN